MIIYKVQVNHPHLINNVVLTSQASFGEPRMFFLSTQCFSIILLFKDFYTFPEWEQVSHSHCQSFWTIYVTTGSIIKKIGRKNTNGHQHLCLPMRIKGWHLHLPFKEEILQNLYLQYKIKIYGYFSNLKDFQMQPQFIAQYI